MTLIQITPAEIAGSRPRDCRGCPVWRAIRRHVRPEVDVVVEQSFAWFSWPSAPARQPVTRLLPVAVSRAIACYDDKREMDPFEFPLDIPAEFLRSAPQ